MICTKKDGYLRKLINSDLMISWMATLSSGLTVFGDYDRPEMDNPWYRLRDYCKETGDTINKIELYMFGAESMVFFEDQNGLDGIFVMRGIAKDQAMDGSHSRSFQTLTVGVLSEDCSYVDVAKYTWPHNDFEKGSSRRVLTEENLKYMIFKNGSKKLEHPEVQKHLNGTAV
jgi:hypothetical protein